MRAFANSGNLPDCNSSATPEPIYYDDGVTPAPRQPLTRQEIIDILREEGMIGTKTKKKPLVVRMAIWAVVVVAWLGLFAGCINLMMWYNSKIMKDGVDDLKETVANQTQMLDQRMTGSDDDIKDAFENKTQGLEQRMKGTVKDQMQGIEEDLEDVKGSLNLLSIGECLLTLHTKTLRISLIH